MGIVNVTPDSFSADGQMAKGVDFTASAARLASRMLRDGADLIDIGGESSRPGAKPISADEEIRRVAPAIRLIKKRTPISISVDTYKPQVALAALDAGADIINTIRGTTPNDKLLKIIKQYNAGVVLMHMRGTPRTMQQQTRYKNLIAEIITDLRRAAENCLEIGIKSDRIIIDPGIGFAKTAEQNLEILWRLNEFADLNLPILTGTSRKSFIGKILNRDVAGRLEGTLASVCVCALHGAHIVRVHDVKPTRQALQVTDAIMNQKITTSS